MQILKGRSKQKLMELRTLDKLIITLHIQLIELHMQAARPHTQDTQDKNIVMLEGHMQVKPV